MEPYREAYWNIGSERYLLIPIAIAATAVFAYALRSHVIMWRLGRAENRFDRPWDRIKGAFLHGFGNRRVLNQAFPGVIHLLIYGGMLTLFAGTILDSAEYYLHLLFSLSFLRGPVYLGYSLALDIAGVLVLAGLLLAAGQRYIARPARLDRAPDDWISLVWIAFIVVSGFLVEGSRIAAREVVQHPDWSAWSPVGKTLALSVGALGITESAQLTIHRVSWWAHLLGAQGWIAYLFYSKLGHVFLSPLNIYFRNLGPGGTLQPIPNLEEAEVLGVASVRDLTWKQLLDSDACTRCGRCQEACPAHSTGKSLSPKQLVVALKSEMMSAARKADPKASGSSNGSSNGTVFGPGLGEEAIWDCTTCGACQRACPVFVEHVQKVVDVRRNLVLMEGRMPEAAQAVLTNLERRGHPWVGARATRTDWMADLGIKPLASGEVADTLLWVGCTGALENRSRKVTVALAKLLQAATVSFGVLGDREACCGDPARRFGNEYLYQSTVQQNIELLASHKVRRIVTHCAHCFNSLKNEYPQLEGNFEVVHHSQLLAQLVKQGRLRPERSVTEKTVVHDSCYLGRHNGVFDAPRETLKAVPGLEMIEMHRSKEASYCCGGGGGHLWMEENGELRINEARSEEALQTGAALVAVSCPFCLQMFEAGFQAKNAANSPRIADISELLEMACSKEPACS